MKRTIGIIAAALFASIALGGCGASSFEPQHKTESETVNVSSGMIPQVIEKTTSYVQNEKDGEWTVENSDIAKWDVDSSFDIGNTAWIITSDDATGIFSALDDSFKNVKATLYIRFNDDLKDVKSEIVSSDEGSKLALTFDMTSDVVFAVNGMYSAYYDVKVSGADLYMDGSLDMKVNADGLEGILSVPADVRQYDLMDFMIVQSQTYIEVIPFENLPSFNVTSSDLNNFVWDPKISDTSMGSNASPDLSWDKVEGASQYVVIMIDGGWLHMDVFTSETSLAEGVYGKGERGAQYVGPYPPKEQTHTYSVFVFALKNEPGNVLMSFDQGSNNLQTIYQGLDKDADGNTGNVLAYGRLDGNFTLK